MTPRQPVDVQDQVKQLAVELRILPPEGKTDTGALEYQIIEWAKIGGSRFHTTLLAPGYSPKDVENKMYEYMDAKSPTTTDKIKMLSEIGNMNGHPPSYQRNMLVGLSALIEILSSSQEKDTQNQLADILTKQLEEKPEHRGGLFIEIGEYITNKRRQEEEKAKIDTAVFYKACIQEIKCRINEEYRDRISNVQSELLSYKQYLKELEESSLKSKNQKLSERIKECDTLINILKDVEIDTQTKVARVSQGLKAMEENLTVYPDKGSQIVANKPSQHNQGLLASAFNTFLDVVAKVFPTVLQYKKGFAETLINADISKDLHEAIKPRK